MRVKLSFFSEQDGNAITLEERIRQIVLAGNWPIILTREDGVELESCKNEQELKAALQRIGIL